MADQLVEETNSVVKLAGDFFNFTLAARMWQVEVMVYQKAVVEESNSEVYRLVETLNLILLILIS